MSDERRSVLLTTLTRREATPGLVTKLAEIGIAGIRLIAKGYRPEEYRENYDELLAAGRDVVDGFRILVDLPGGKPRISSHVHDLKVERGMRLLLHGERDQPSEGEPPRVPTVGLMPFVTNIEPGHRIMVADGSIEMSVVARQENGILVEVMSDTDEVTASRSINLPDSHARYSSRGNDDGVLLAFERDTPLEVAVSMVADRDDVDRVRTLLPEASVTAKLETQTGLDHLAEITEAADELLIARGDLSIEMPLRLLCSTCELIQRSAHGAGTRFILAAGFLDAVARTGHPSIAEVSDLWHHHRAGVRTFMLSGTVCVTNPVDVTRWAKMLLDDFDRADARLDDRTRIDAS
ncbi:MAG: pyruvate kinase [Solirubrobacteraceae bacterium]|jgi:pyruvate kinase|nr:pyruvate kinase [Solirubrobacteraceae bacterium]